MSEVDFITEIEIDEIIKELGQNFTLEGFMRKAFKVDLYWGNITNDMFEVFCLYRDKYNFARLLVVSTDADNYYSLQGWSETYKSDIKRNLIDVLNQSIFLISTSEDSVFEKIINWAKPVGE